MPGTKEQTFNVLALSKFLFSSLRNKIGDGRITHPSGILFNPLKTYSLSPKFKFKRYFNQDKVLICFSIESSS
jgi:hypothetical protein